MRGLVLRVRMRKNNAYLFLFQIIINGMMSRMVIWMLRNKIRLSVETIILNTMISKVSNDESKYHTISFILYFDKVVNKN